MAARHRAPEQPPRPDRHPDRLGAHDPTPFNADQVPADKLLGRLRKPPEESR